MQLHDKGTAVVLSTKTALRGINSMLMLRKANIF